MEDLSTKTCQPCREGDLPVSKKKISEYLDTLPEWGIMEREGVPRLERSYEFSDFREALDFTNKVGEIAEQEDHHPAILLTWGRVVVSWWTHAIKDLHINDFILAARTEELYRNR